MNNFLKLRLEVDEAITYGDIEKAEAIARDGIAMAIDMEDLGEREYFSAQIDIIREKYVSAIEHLNKAIRHNNNDGAAYNDIALSMIELGEKEFALRYFDRGISMEPDYATIYHNKGWLLNQLGRYEEAVVYLNKALKLDPNRAVTYENLADICVKKGNKNDAIRYYERAIDLVKPEYEEIKEELKKKLRELD